MHPLDCPIGKRGRVAHLSWTLVLAGGKGTRLSTVTGGVPKQFWSPDGAHTMIEHTLVRMRTLATPSRTMTVIGPDQRDFLNRVRSTALLGTVLEQPADRGTGVAVLWGLCRILAQDPQAVVVMTPADHGIESEAEYREGIRLAVRSVTAGLHSAVLFGVTPSRPDTDYGWIVPATSGDSVDRRLFRNVATFAEKPSGPEAARLMSLGSLWNTMVLVGRADQLVGLFRSRFANLVDQATLISRTTAAEEIRDIFCSWPTVDFSRDVLSAATRLAVYTWRPSIGWCDLGTESRLRRWQERGRLHQHDGRAGQPIADRVSPLAPLAIG